MGNSFTHSKILEFEAYDPNFELDNLGLDEKDKEDL